MFFYNNREVSAQTTPCQTQSFTPLAVNKGEHKFLRVLIWRAEFLLQTTINTYSASHTELFVCLNYSPLMRIIYGSQRQDTPRNTPHNGVHINKQTHKPTCKSSLLPCSNINICTLLRNPFRVPKQYINEYIFFSLCVGEFWGRRGSAKPQIILSLRLGWLIAQGAHP